MKSLIVSVRRRPAGETRPYSRAFQNCIRKLTAPTSFILPRVYKPSVPVYSLYQRDRSDAPEPLAMFFYNPDTTGDWWYNLPLDHYFSNPNDAWASFRSSWTDTQGTYSAIKAGNLTGHQVGIGHLSSGSRM